MLKNAVYALHYIFVTIFWYKTVERNDDLPAIVAFMISSDAFRDEYLVGEGRQAYM